MVLSWHSLIWAGFSHPSDLTEPTARAGPWVAAPPNGNPAKTAVRLRAGALRPHCLSLPRTSPQPAWPATSKDAAFWLHSLYSVHTACFFCPKCCDKPGQASQVHTQYATFRAKAVLYHRTRDLVTGRSNGPGIQFHGAWRPPLTAQRTGLLNSSKRPAGSRPMGRLGLHRAGCVSSQYGQRSRVLPSVVPSHPEAYRDVLPPYRVGSDSSPEAGTDGRPCLVRPHGRTSSSLPHQTRTSDHRAIRPR